MKKIACSLTMAQLIARRGLSVCRSDQSFTCTHLVPNRRSAKTVQQHLNFPGEQL
jgi:hypothetical protein